MFLIVALAIRTLKHSSVFALSYGVSGFIVLSFFENIKSYFSHHNTFNLICQSLEYQDLVHLIRHLFLY